MFRTDSIAYLLCCFLKEKRYIFPRDYWTRLYIFAGASSIYFLVNANIMVLLLEDSIRLLPFLYNQKAKVIFLIKN